MQKLTVLEYALLSESVYKSEVCPEGWEVAEKAAYCNATVYRCMRDKNLFVLAFRGTADLSDVMADISILLNREDSIFFRAYNFYKHFKNALPDVCRVHLTGHSLGGALAAFCAFYSRHTQFCPLVEACTFNAVPIQAIIQAVYPNADLSNVCFIKNFCDRYDIVPSLFGKKQLGQAQSMVENAHALTADLLGRVNIFAHHSMQHMKENLQALAEEASL